MTLERRQPNANYGRPLPGSSYTRAAGAFCRAGARREAMFQDLRLLRQVERHRPFRWSAAPNGWRRFNNWRDDIDRCTRTVRPARLADYSRSVRKLSTCKGARMFFWPSSWHGDGCAAGYRAGRILATSNLVCNRVARGPRWDGFSVRVVSALGRGGRHSWLRPPFWP